MKGFLSPILVIAFIFIFQVGCVGQTFTPANSEVSLKADPVQAAGSVLLFEITIKNIGPKPIVFVTGGPGHYPDAEDFPATVVSLPGASRDVVLRNWQYKVWHRCTRIGIKPGESITFPAGNDPVSAGTYTFSLKQWRDKSVLIVVRDDPILKKTYDDFILSMVGQNVPFFEEVAANYKNKFISDALLHDLLSDDLKTAHSAAAALYEFRGNLPGSTDQIDSEALVKNLAAASHVERGEANSSLRGSLLTYLSLILAETKTDMAFDAVLGLARSREIDAFSDSAGQGNQIRRSAVSDLAEFPQPRAASELESFLGDKDMTVRFAAAEGLAYRKDPAALEALLALAQDPKDGSRGEYFGLLAGGHYQDPRIRPILQKALGDRSDGVRTEARSALIELDRKG